MSFNPREIKKTNIGNLESFPMFSLISYLSNLISHKITYFILRYVMLNLISHKITYFILRYVILYSVFTQGALKLVKSIQIWDIVYSRKVHRYKFN